MSTSSDGFMEKYIWENNICFFPDTDTNTREMHAYHQQHTGGKMARKKKKQNEEKKWF